MAPCNPPSSAQIVAYFRNDQTLARLELFGRCNSSPTLVRRLSMQLTDAAVETLLFDCKITWAACAVLFEAITATTATELPDPLQTFVTSDTIPSWSRNRHAVHPTHMVVNGVPALGLPAGTDPLFRHVLRHPAGTTTPFRLQPRDAKMLTGLLAHVLQNASWNVFKSGGSCCFQCANGHPLLEDCRGLASDNVPEEDGLDFPVCTCCYAQGLTCTWPEATEE
jgi:hypothetical protein